MKKISVIIPVYKQGGYVSEAIESVLAQTVKADEIIVINDGSPDASSVIAKGYPVRVIDQVNKGLASARNTGIMNSSGDYIQPLDADDKMLENCLEKIHQKIEETDADIVAPSFKNFGIDNSDVILMENPTIADFKIANRIGYFSAIKRSALLEVGGYSPRMTWGYEDYHLWINLLSRGKKLVTMQDILIMYRVKEQSMIHEAQSHHVELMTQIVKDFPLI